MPTTSPSASIGKLLLYKPFFNVLVFLSFLFGGHLGVAIIVLTIMVRLALFPVFRKTLELSKKQRDIQPQLNEIRKKYKDNKEKQTKEMMKLFAEHKVNPLASCFPMIVQIIILISLFSVLREGIDKSLFDSYLYSFVPRPDNIHTHFLIFDLTKPDLWVLPLLAGAFQFIQSKMMMGRVEKKTTKSIQATLTTQMVYIFPLFTVVIARQFPAALALYWTVNTLFSVYQQYLVNHELDLFFRKTVKKSPKVSVKVKKKKK